eukprot:gene4187-5958_t
MQVNCQIHGGNFIENNICTFFLPLSIKITSNESNGLLPIINEAFPFEGNYHFRLKVSAEACGFDENANSNTIHDYYWLDVNAVDDIAKILNYMSTVGIIEMQALIIDAPLDDSDNTVSYENYLMKLNKEIPFERQLARYVDDDTHHDDEENELMGKVNKVFTSFAHNVFKVAPKNVNMNSVKAGASNIFKAVKSISTNNINNNGQKLNEISPIALENLSELSNKVSTTFQDSNVSHILLMQRLWETLFPTQPYNTNNRISDTWKQAGWQKNDPIHDLKNSGVLAIQSIINLGKAYPERTQQMLLKNKENKKTNYPFAIVGVNITLLLSELLYLKDGKYLNVSTNFWELFRDSEAFYQIFNICFIHVDSLWTYRQSVRADFGKIIGEVKQIVSQILARGPTTTEEFKLIAADEGMTIIDN